MRYEFYKYFTRFHVILLTTLLVLSVGLTAFQYRERFSREQREIDRVKASLLTLYKEDPAEYRTILAEHQKREAEYQAALDESMYAVEMRGLPVFENQYIEFERYNDRSLFQEVEQTIHAEEDYQLKMTSLLRDSVTRMEESSPDTYIYRYYVNLCQHYIPLSTTTFAVEESKGWNEYFSLTLPTVLLAIALIGTFCDIFTADRRAGMHNILHISKYGGRATVRAKLGFLCAASAVITLLFTLCPLPVFALSGGLSSMSQPIQTLSEFVYCPYSLTIGQYFLLYLLLRTAFFTTITLLVAVVSQIFENEKFALLAAVVLAVSGVFLGRIAPTSPVYFLQKFSISEIARVNLLFTRYRGLNMAGQCVSYTGFIIAAFVVVAGISVTLSLLHTPKSIAEYAAGHQSKGAKVHTLSLLKTEAYKQLICEKSWCVLLAAVILKCVFAGIAYRPPMGGVEDAYRNYITEMGGPLTEEQFQKVEEESAYIAKSIAEYDSARSAYRTGTMAEEEFKGYQNRYNYAMYNQNACDRLCLRRNHLRSVCEDYPGVEFVYDEGITRYLDTSFDVISIVAMLFIGSNLFSCEYESRTGGIAPVLRSTKRGRKDVFHAKVRYALLSAVGLYLIFALINAGWISHYYDVDFLNAHIMSLPRFAEMGLALDMSIGEYLLLHQAVSLVGTLTCCLLASSLSAMTKNQMKAILISAFFVLIPYFVGTMRILPFSLLNYAEMVSPQNILSDGVSYLTCVASVLLCTLAAFHRWCDGAVPSRKFHSILRFKSHAS